MTYQTIVVAGIQVDVWANEPNPSINQLPVSLLFLLHGREGSRKSKTIKDIAERMLRIQRASTINSDWKRELVIASFDQRNHGSRLVDAKANLDWNLDKPDRHNERHALDMYAIQVGTAHDVSNIADFLPSYLYPEDERTIDQWAIAGFSLGGHATWIALKNDKRLEVGIPIVGCPDYLSLIIDRAKIGNVDVGSPAHFPPSLIRYIEEHDPISALPNPPIKNTNPFLHRRILAIAGAKDPLVPWRFSQEFWERLDVGEDGVKENFVDENAGHEWTEKMGDKMAEFVQKQCLE